MLTSDGNSTIMIASYGRHCNCYMTEEEKGQGREKGRVQLRVLFQCFYFLLFIFRFD